jgi:hypothetical protein
MVIVTLVRGREAKTTILQAALASSFTEGSFGDGKNNPNRKLLSVSLKLRHVIPLTPV